MMRIKNNPQAEYFGYFSHHIRGVKGAAATDEDMLENCAEASRVAHEIMDLAVQIDLHIPADHDEFVCVGHRLGFFDEEVILNIDCGIIAQRQFMIAYAYQGYTSHGMDVEINYCKENNIPLFIFSEWNKETKLELIAWLAGVVLKIRKEKHE